MNGFQQTWHVIRKDLRQQKWSLGVFTLVVAAAAAMAVHALPIETVRRTPLVILVEGGVLVTILGAALSAMVVQSDSPSRSDAFWSSRPLSPSAVFAAKMLLLGVVLIGLPLAAQGLALAMHGTEAEHLPRWLVVPGVAHAGLLLGAALVAGLTRDMRTFVLAFAGVAAGWGFVEMLMQSGSRVGRPMAWVEWARPLLWTGAGATLLLHQYRKRHSKRTLLMGLAIFAAWVAVIPLARDETRAFSPVLELPRRAPPAAIARPAVSLATVHLQPTGPSRGSRPVMWRAWAELELRGTSPRYSYHLGNVRLTVSSDRGGSSSGSPYEWRRLGPPGAPPGFPAWINLPADDGFIVDLGHLSEDDVALLADGRVQLGATLRVEVFETTIVARAPAAPGASARWGGGRVDVTRPRPGALVSVQGEEISSDPNRFYPGLQDLGARFALVRRDLDEALALDKSDGYSSHPLVLPGTHVQGFTVDLTERGRGRGAFSVAPGWVEGAELVVFEQAHQGGWEFELPIRDYAIEGR